MLAQIGGSPPRKRRKAGTTTAPAPTKSLCVTDNTAHDPRAQLLVTRYRVAANLADLIASLCWPGVADD